MIPELHDTITRVRGVEQDGAYGSTEIDWTGASEVELPAEVQPVGTTAAEEAVLLQQRTEYRLRVFFYPGVDVRETDRFRWQQKLYDVDGMPRRWRMHGQENHVEVVLLRVEGG